LGDAAAAAAGDVRADAPRPADQAVGPLRAGAGAEGMRLSLSLPLGLRLLAIAAVAVVIAWLPTTMSDYHRLQGAGVGVFFMAILGLNIVTGYTGQISIGHRS